MASHRIRARPPAEEVPLPEPLTTEDEIAPFLRDAACTAGGHTPRIFRPRSESEVAAVLHAAPQVLAIGAQSSLTGGATPMGEWVLATSRLDQIGDLAHASLTCGAGVSLVALHEALARHRMFLPPTPTFRGACVGGAVSTNAAGAATFKYGSVRDWVAGLTVVLADGSVLDLVRGECRAHPEGYFEIEGVRKGSVRRVPVPTYRMPDVPKRSAGYHAEPGMDLVDLFVGSEGTLAVVVAVKLRVAPQRPKLVGSIAIGNEALAVAIAARLRTAARAAWASGDRDGIDVISIESLDARCLELLREDGTDRELGLALPPQADTLLLFECELPAGTDARTTLEGLARPADAGPLGRLTRLLDDAGASDATEIALPGDTQRAARLAALREAVPIAVNHRIEDAQRRASAGIHKVAGDMIVPFDRIADTLKRYRRAFASRGLDHAFWGHISDGNIHANAIPRTPDDVRLGEDAILELAEDVIACGGCPLSEHGVGRNPIKQELLRRLYGPEGIEQMRAVKAALDPEWKLAPGVIFSAQPGRTAEAP